MFARQCSFNPAPASDMVRASIGSGEGLRCRSIGQDRPGWRGCRDRWARKNDERQTWRQQQYREPEHRGRRPGAAEDEETRNVQGADAERRLHADGVRRSRPGTILPEVARGSHQDHAARAPPRGRRMRRLYLRGGRDQGDAGHGPGAAEPASSAMHDREGMIARIRLLTTRWLAETGTELA